MNWLGQCDQSRGRDDRGDREEQRDQRGDGGAEDEQQDHERQRQRDHAGRLEHAVERVVDCLAGAGAAELVDLEARVPGCGLVDGGLDLLDVEDGLVVGALRAELHHRRVAVGRDLIGVTSLERRVELADLRHRVERLGDVLDRGLERRIGRLQGLGLDQDDLALLVGGLREAGLDDLGRGAGLADGEVVVLEVLRADRAADDDGRDDEREPAEDRGLPVVRTPAAHAGCEVVAVLQG